MSPGNPQLMIRVPESIGLWLRRDAKKRGVTVQAVILEIVAGHYGVVIEIPKRGGQRRVKE